MKKKKNIKILMLCCDMAHHSFTFAEKFLKNNKSI